MNYGNLTNKTHKPLVNYPKPLVNFKIPVIKLTRNKKIDQRWTVLKEVDTRNQKREPIYNYVAPKPKAKREYLSNNDVVDDIETDILLRPEDENSTQEKSSNIIYIAIAAVVAWFIYKNN